MNLQVKAYIAHCVRAYIDELTQEHDRKTNKEVKVNEIMQRNQWFEELDCDTNEVRNFVKDCYEEYE